MTKGVVLKDEIQQVIDDDENERMKLQARCMLMLSVHATQQCLYIVDF